MNKKSAKKDLMGYSQNNRVKLVQGGKPYFDLMLKLIDNATSLIQLQVYILSEDVTGRMILDALYRAIDRKVKVYLMTDGYASQGLSRGLISELKQKGVFFRFFEPFLKSQHFYFGRRMHHKVFVADSSYALVGGINISDRYNDLQEVRAWLDFAIYAEGEVARDCCIICWKTWSGFMKPVRLNRCEMLQMNFDSCEVRMIRNDWVRRKNEISSSYINMFRKAESHITIMCSYFLPGAVIRRVLSEASKRGVRIRIVTAGPSDVKLAKQAERWLYDWLLRNKIELYEYQPAVLHAKMAVCDDNWLTVGSYNINDISAYASIELNLEVKNGQCAWQAQQMLDTIIKQDCIAITPESHTRNTNILRQFFRWSSYAIIRAIFYSLTFYYKRNKK